MNRYERQINLRGFGTEGQRKLRQSSVLVIGAGGLGCPALLYLAAAGVGKIGIADGDTICLSNLNRQIVYSESDEDKKKAVVAGAILSHKYSDIEVNVFSKYIDNNNAIDILSKFDVIMDCTDNFSTRYLVNDACVLLNKPFVYGAIYEYEGQVSLFNVCHDHGIACNYRDLFPVPPDPSQIPNCDDTGVLGVLPGIIGNIQAAEVIKFLAGVGTLLSGRVLHYNLAHQQFYELNISPHPEAYRHMPQTELAFRNFDYSLSCSAVETIEWDKAHSIFNHDSRQSIFVDVRESGELPKAEHIPYIHLPLSQLSEGTKYFVDQQSLFVFCQHGIRSAKAVGILKKIFPEKNIFSIKGGIMDNHSPIKKIWHEA